MLGSSSPSWINSRVNSVAYEPNAILSKEVSMCLKSSTTLASLRKASEPLRLSRNETAEMRKSSSAPAKRFLETLPPLAMAEVLPPGERRSVRMRSVSP